MILNKEIKELEKDLKRSKRDDKKQNNNISALYVRLAQAKLSQAKNDQILFLKEVKMMDLEDWEDSRFGSAITKEYKEAFNHGLFMARAEIRKVLSSFDTKEIIE